jgi:hypothetical protein
MWLMNARFEIIVLSVSHGCEILELFLPFIYAFCILVMKLVYLKGVSFLNCENTYNPIPTHAVLHNLLRVCSAAFYFYCASPG